MRAEETGRQPAPAPLFLIYPWADGGGVLAALGLSPRLPWWLRNKGPACQCRRHRLNPWAGRIPWGRKWIPSPVFLPGKCHGQRSLVGYSPWGCKKSDMTERARIIAGKIMGPKRLVTSQCLGTAAKYWFLASRRKEFKKELQKSEKRFIQGENRVSLQKFLL